MISIPLFTTLFTRTEARAVESVFFIFYHNIISYKLISAMRSKMSGRRRKFDHKH